MELEKYFGSGFFILLGFYSIIARKYNAYNALKRNVFKPNYDEKHLKRLEVMSLVFGFTFIGARIVILIHG